MTRTTSDGNGNTWLLDGNSRTAYMIDEDKLHTQRCMPADPLTSDFNFIGVAGDYIYAASEGSILRYNTDGGTMQPLKMLGTFSWSGETECAGGVIYSFGGLINYRGTYSASKIIRQFSPADYAPVSVSILPE